MLLEEFDGVIRAIIQQCDPPGPYVTTFHYNSAIMRIAACYERLLLAIRKAGKITSKQSKRTSKTERTKGNRIAKTERWIVEIEQQLSTGPLRRSHLESICDEVNRLKHALFGFTVNDAKERSKHIDPDDVGNALHAFVELLDILQNNKIFPLMESKYRRLSPP